MSTENVSNICDLSLSSLEKAIEDSNLDRLDRAAVEELDDNEVYIGSNEYALPMSLPITMKAYAGSRFEGSGNRKWYLSKYGVGFVEHIEKLGLVVNLDVPNEGFCCNNEIRYDYWWVREDSDGMIGCGHILDYGMVTKAHLSFKDTRKLTTGVYFCADNKCACFIIEKDGESNLYYPADDSYNTGKLLSIGQIIFDMGDCYEQVKSDNIKEFNHLVKLMDYDSSVIPE